mmetsp:Transcript_16665/g.30998  ORF Transcript_16665/g.30998 Transcript_16665/m.30998 type:complete len:659 (-) Transcript_16665:233-2209(-)
MESLSSFPTEDSFSTEVSLPDLARVVPRQPDSPKPDSKKFLKNRHRSVRPTEEGRPRFGEISNKEARLMEGVSETDLLSELPYDGRPRDMMSDPTRGLSTTSSFRSSTRSCGRVSAPSQPHCERISYRRMKFRMKACKATEGGIAASFTQAASSIIENARRSQDAAAGSDSEMPNSRRHSGVGHQLKEVNMNDPVIQALEAKVVVSGASSILKSLQATGGLSSTDDFVEAPRSYEAADSQQDSGSSSRKSDDVDKKKSSPFRMLNWNLTKSSGASSSGAAVSLDCFPDQVDNTLNSSPKSSRSATGKLSDLLDWGSNSEKTSRSSTGPQMPSALEDHAVLNTNGLRGGTGRSLLTPSNISRTSTEEMKQDRESFMSTGSNKQALMTLESVGSSDYEPEADRPSKHTTEGSRSSSDGPMLRTFTVRELPPVLIDELSDYDKQQDKWAPMNAKKKSKESAKDIDLREKYPNPPEVTEEYAPKCSEPDLVHQKTIANQQIEAPKEDSKHDGPMPEKDRRHEVPMPEKCSQLSNPDVTGTCETFDRSTRVTPFGTFTDVAYSSEQFGLRDSWEARCTDEQTRDSFGNPVTGTSSEVITEVPFDILNCEELTDNHPKKKLSRPSRRSFNEPSLRPFNEAERKSAEDMGAMINTKQKQAHHRLC